MAPDDGLLGNTLSDFPPDQFEILAFCESCGRQALMNREVLPSETIVQTLPKRLRCLACGSRECSIRILYKGAGGCRYG